MQNDNSDRNLRIIFFIFSIIGRYGLYVLLSVPVILTFVAIVMILDTYGISFGFFRYFAFLDPEFATGTFSLDYNKIMQLFGVISLILMIVTESVKFIFKLKETPIKRKIIYVVSILTCIYILGAISVSISEKFFQKNTFFLVLFIVYITSTVSAIFYIKLSREFKEIFS